MSFSLEYSPGQTIEVCGPQRAVVWTAPEVIDERGVRYLLFQEAVSEEMNARRRRWLQGDEIPLSVERLATRLPCVNNFFMCPDGCDLWVIRYC